jgi:D-alanine-D-alanine ligase
MKRPPVAIFFGGTPGNHDLSQETGYWACHYIPRSKYDVIPVHINEDGKWQVPLGTLPQHGTVDRMLDVLFQSVPAVSPHQGLERLMRHPLRAFMTVLRGPGGDDGAMHALGKTLGVPVIGSSTEATAQKHLLNRMVDDIVPTPLTRHFAQRTPTEAIIEEARRDFVPPFFVKPAQEEGSVGIEEVHSMDELLPALKRVQASGDILLQERSPGTELTITLIQDSSGSVQILPTTAILPTNARFYDHMAKRRAGRVAFQQVPWQDDWRTTEGAAVARELFDALGCQDCVSVDVTVGESGPTLLEVNTIPTFTEFTPLRHQLSAAGLHPTTLFDRLLQRRLS